VKRFHDLLACIRSGQLNEEQIAAELRDPAFADFYRQQTRDRPMCDKPGRERIRQA